MLTLHHADELEPLLDSLATLLDKPLDDPFIAEVVAVPSAGMADAVMAALGTRLGSTGRGDGIVANVDFLFLGQFVQRALGDTERTADPWAIDQLTWAVLHVIDANPALLPWVGESTSGTATGPSRDPWALARRIADLFDQYASQRPSLIRAWAEGLDTDGTRLADETFAPLDASHSWQANLWRAVRQHLGVPSPPERLPQQLEPQLPPRVAVFGIGSVPYTLLSTLRSLAKVRDVHVFLRHPSRVAWNSSPHRLAGGLQVRSGLNVTSHINHPLLASWGRPALEARALLGGLTDVVEVAESRKSEPTTLLGHLQHGIRHDVAPTAVTAKPDDTIQVHACHGAFRQLEVLRDALGHAFVADPTLQAHEVLVLCPDLETFAPLVESVLNRGGLPVPVRVGDRSLTTEDPLASVLQAALELVEGRATLTQVLSLAQTEPVRTRFGWEADQIGKIAGWCTTLGTRWGLLPEHRVRWGIPGEVQGGTWRAMSDRLLAGAAMPAPVDRAVLGDVVPFDDMGSEDVLLAGAMADFLARLVWLHGAIAESKPISDWVDVLHTAVDHFCAVGRDEHWRIAVLHNILDNIRAAAGPSAVLLSATDIKAVLANHLSERPGRLRLRTGAVTVTSLIPLRGVSARVICILGLDDGVVRTGSFDGDDVLGLRPCVGERHPRYESRHLLLDAVLAAQDRLLITCNGADLTTNKDIPFTVALAELMDAVTVLGVRPVKHPRHGFHERALVPGALGADQPFTFDPDMLEAAQVHRGSVESASDWALPPRPIERLDLDHAVSALVNPSRVYLRDRLDIRLPGEVETLDDGLPISLDPLDLSALGRALLAARREGVDYDEWQATARITGTLPPGDLATAALTNVISDVKDFEAVLAACGVTEPAREEREIDLSLEVPVGASVSTVQFSGTVTGLKGTLLVETRYTRPRDSQRLGLALRLAALQVQFPNDDWSALLVTRKEDDDAKETPVTSMRFVGTGAERVERAHRFLVRAVQVAEWAQRDAVPLFERASASIAERKWGTADNQLIADLQDDSVRFLWGDSSLDDLRDTPMRHTDPAELRSLGSEGRAVATADWVWGLFDEVIDTDGAAADEGGDDE